MKTTMTGRSGNALNRTGMQANPEHAPDMLEVTALTEPSSTSDEATIEDMRREAIGRAEPVGSPPPGVSTAQAQLLDKLGERLAYERGGTRLYDAMLVKAAALGSFPGGPAEGDLRRIRDQEHEHMQLIAEAIVELGGDPTALTPGGDFSVVASSGLRKIMADPRTTLGQCLEALLIAELADGDAWELLIAVAREAGEDALAQSLARPRAEEEQHIVQVRAWVKAYAAHAASRAPSIAGGRRMAMTVARRVKAAAVRPARGARTAQRRGSRR